ncbi:phage lytic cycle repressor MrpR family protein [Thermoanaerobacterium thermosaccharolyticum]|uniref:phage lytic cycle repressor MrpR family protein n=1 Tax=Thermoanaerobacterium thermosaccharolyticum TaxID=1517 RepID=UPI003DA9D249
MSKIYNKELKNRFMEQYLDSTKMAYEIIFKKTAKTEEQLGKDLCNFNFSEIDGLLYSMGAKTIESLVSAVSVLSGYTDFCILEGYVPTKMNYYRQFTDKELLKKYLNRFALRKMYLKNKEELQLIKSRCDNAQDKVIFALLWEGVMGENLEELVNLKVEDVDFENNRIHIEGKHERIMTVERDTINSIQDAIEEKYYIRRNETIADSNMPLKITPYVLRPIVRKNSKTKINPIAIRNRVTHIAELYNNPYVTPTNIQRSGMMYYIKKMMEEKGYKTFKDVESKDLEPILKRYGYDYTPQNVFKIRLRLKDYID